MIFLMIFLAVAVGKQAEAYRQAGPGCGALLTQDIVTKTFIVTGSLNSSFDETHALLNSSNGWCSRSLNPNEHLLVELGKVATITGFDIQGRSSSNQYVTDFTMSYKATKQMRFLDYSRFIASPSSGDEIVHFQVNATDMQVVGFFPRNYNEHICMRVELYGCVPVDGGYTPWSAWNSCSNLCGNGTQRRHRECSNPAPANNGQSCVGNSTETRGCVNTSCPGLSEWSKWTSCSVTCGNGSQSRSRNCTNLRPRNGVKSCKEYRTCRLEQCEVDGGYTPWSAWNSCSNLCGSGTQRRHRECSNPAPANNGQRCVGNSTETRGCVNTSCPVDRANSSSSSMEGDQRKDKFFTLMVVLAAALPVAIVT